MPETVTEWQLAVIEGIREVRDVMLGIDASLRALRTTENEELELLEREKPKKKS